MAIHGIIASGMKVNSRNSLLFAVVLLLVSCGGGPRLAPLSRDAVVVAFGDSLTYGTGASAEESYPVVLQGAISRRVVNAGVPGEVTGEGVRRLPRVLDETSPSLLILCHGGNDMLRKLGEDATAENIRQMIQMAMARGVGVVLVGVPRPGIFLDPPEFYEQIADEMNIPYEGEVMSGVLSKGGLKSDAIHPNAQGYREVAEAIAELLQRAGAL